LRKRTLDLYLHTLFGDNQAMKYFVRSRPTLAWQVLVVCVFAVTVNIAQAASPQQVADSSAYVANVNGLIVKFDKSAGRDDARMRTAGDRASALSAALSRQAGQAIALNFSRELASGADLHRFDSLRTLADATALAATISQLRGVVYATPNRTMFTQATPLDAQYSSQWGFRFNASSQGANFEAAWDITKGSAAQTIGIVDSGIARTHPELSGQLRTHSLFPFGGYDFMKNPAGSGDGDGRDANPEQSPSACGHGSHVAGTIAAATKFTGGGAGVGVAGGASASKVLMARALDFTGEEADVIDAMLWLAGIAVPDVAVNPSPAKVINMSLGGAGACGAGYRDAVDQLTAVGTVVVAAAGNNSSDVSNFAPASCTGVVAVAASTISGGRASFSNFGAGVTITAPGDSIFSTGGSVGENCYKSGTSMAAPHVTAAISLAQSVNSNLSVEQVMLALRAGARGFPSGSSCSTSICGVGLLDAYGVIQRALPNALPSAGWASGATSVRENDGNVTLTLARVGNPNAATTLNVTMLNDTAIEATDFGAVSAPQVTWAAGDTATKTVSVPILNRPGEQGARRFSVALSAATSGVTVVAPSVLPIRITEVDCNSVTPMSIGDTVNSNLGVVGNTYCKGGIRGPEYDTVRYSFSANAGDFITITMNSTTASPGVLDPYVYLLDSNFRVLAENDDIVAGAQRNSLIEQFEITSTGTYYIDATTWSPTTDKQGTFALSVLSCGPYRAGTTCNLDVDGDGFFDTRDATMALRRIMGFSADNVRAGMTLRACATRREGNQAADFVDTQLALETASNIRPYDFDGDGVVSATTDGVIMLRAALGLSGDAIVANATSASAPRKTWAQVVPYLNQSCGTTFSVP
jgi:serine protease